MGLIPEETNEKYNIKDIVTNGWVYIKIQKGMYGLPQAGVLAYRLLTTPLVQKIFTPDNSHPAWGATCGAPSHLS